MVTVAGLTTIESASALPATSITSSVDCPKPLKLMPLIGNGTPLVKSIVSVLSLAEPVNASEVRMDLSAVNAGGTVVSVSTKICTRVPAGSRRSVVARCTGERGREVAEVHVRDLLPDAQRDRAGVGRGLRVACGRDLAQRRCFRRARS
jgi:hypothetical protein